MLIVGYYTENTPYVDEANRLRANLDRMGLRHDFREVPNLGSWQKNTQYKSHFVEDMLIEHAPHPIVYCDVDAEFRHCPTLLFKLPASGIDIAACKHGGHELLSGTVFFSNSECCMQVVARWQQLCHTYPERFPGGLLPHFPKGDIAWDQRMLDLAIRQLIKENVPVNFQVMPPEYCFIFDISAAKYPEINDPIIVHTAASRAYKKHINSGGKLPPKPRRPQNA